jgi:hypothetical protein
MMRNPSASLSILGLCRGIAGNAYGFDGCPYRPGIANGGGGGGPRCDPVCCREYIMVEVLALQLYTERLRENI